MNDLISLANTQVLIVEDEPNNRRVTAVMLRMASLNPDNIAAVEGDPLPFMHLSLPRRFDLVLLDIQMPYKDGYAVLAEIRNDPVFSNTKVVALTANAAIEELQRARKAGFDGFISKPLNVDLLSEQIGTVLSGNKIWHL